MICQASCDRYQYAYENVPAVGRSLMANPELREGIRQIEEVFPTSQNIEDTRLNLEAGGLPFLAAVYQDGPPSQPHSLEIADLLGQIAMIRRDEQRNGVQPVVIHRSGDLYAYVPVGDQFLGEVVPTGPDGNELSPDDPDRWKNRVLYRYVALDGGEKITIGQAIGIRLRQFIHFITAR